MKRGTFVNHSPYFLMGLFFGCLLGLILPCCASQPAAEPARPAPVTAATPEAPKARTPLHNCAIACDEECAGDHLVRGADPHATDDQQATPLHHAANVGCLGVAKMLLDVGADVNAGAENFIKPAMAAVMADKPEMLELLAARGADLFTKSEGIGLLHLAAAVCSERMADFLLDNKLNPSLVGKFGITPALFAAQCKNKTLELLVNAGADVHKATENQQVTTLHIAAMHNAHENVTMLMNMGVSPSSQNKSGETPADYAEAHGHSALAEFLRSAASTPEDSATPLSPPEPADTEP